MRFIKKTGEYQEVYRDHRRVPGKYFTLLYRFKDDSQEAAIGIVIKSKVGKAVIRNKLKRRIRAYLQQAVNQCDKTLCAVIIARDNAAEAGWEEIKRDLDRCFTAAGVCFQTEQGNEN